MNPRGLLDLLWDSFLTWLGCALHPVSTVSRMLRDFDRNRPFALIKRIWTPALILSVIATYPLLSLFGIKWDNIEYFAPQELTVVIWSVANALVVHLSLRVFGAKSEVYKTTLMYTIVMIYSPITTLIGIPLSRNYFANVQLFKHTNPSLDQVFNWVWSHGYLGNISTQPPLTSMTNVWFYSTAFIGFLILSAFAEYTIQWYGNPRYRTYLAVGVASYCMMIVYTWVTLPIQTLALYAVIQ